MLSSTTTQDMRTKDSQKKMAREILWAQNSMTAKYNDDKEEKYLICTKEYGTTQGTQADSDPQKNGPRDTGPRTTTAKYNDDQGDGQKSYDTVFHSYARYACTGQQRAKKKGTRDTGPKIQQLPNPMVRELKKENI